VVRFKGLTQFGKGEWVGIELGVPEGKHNGTWLGVTYFECPENHGIFVRATNLELRDREVGAPAPADVIASGGGLAERMQADVSPLDPEGRPGGSADVMRTSVQEEGGLRESEGGALAPGAAPFSPWRSSGKGTVLLLQELSNTASFESSFVSMSKGVSEKRQRGVVIRLLTHNTGVSSNLCFDRDGSSTNLNPQILPGQQTGVRRWSTDKLQIPRFTAPTSVDPQSFVHHWQSKLGFRTWS
jgi:hypothetical protein